MTIYKTTKDNLSQIVALVEKNLKLTTRFKFNIVTSLINPIIMILMPLIIMTKLFEFNEQFGPWTRDNFMVYQFLAYNVYLLMGLNDAFGAQFSREKYWKTIQALIIAPFNRFNLLFGIFIPHLIIISIPFTIFFIITYIYYPISFITLIFVIILFFLIALIFSGIGLILGIFIVSNENIYYLLRFSLNIVFWISCISYPFQLFPDLVQQLINLNPLYYVFEILRLTWIEDDIVFSITSHTFHFFVLIIISTLLPCIGVYIFNIIYKKYGIVGY